jgi:hypothetical protein
MGQILNQPPVFALLLLLVLAVALELGYRVGAHLRIQEEPNRKEQMGTIRDGLFFLVSLVLGFTLALAAGRFADRRSLLIEEAVSVGTTYLRASTLPQPYRGHSQSLFREYVDTRLELDRAAHDDARFTEASNRSKHIQEELWGDASAVAQSDRTAITAAYINSLNEMIDLHEKRVAAFENRIPAPIWLMIAAVSVIAVFSRGMTLAARFWLTVVLIPLTIAIVVGLIADLDAPSTGLIRLDQRAMQRLHADLRVEPAHVELAH